MQPPADSHFVKVNSCASLSDLFERFVFFVPELLLYINVIVVSFTLPQICNCVVRDSRYAC